MYSYNYLLLIWVLEILSAYYYKILLFHFLNQWNKKCIWKAPFWARLLVVKTSVCYTIKNLQILELLWIKLFWRAYIFWTVLLQSYFDDCTYEIISKQNQLSHMSVATHFSFDELKTSWNYWIFFSPNIAALEPHFLSNKKLWPKLSLCHCFWRKKLVQ